MLRKTRLLFLVMILSWFLPSCDQVNSVFQSEPGPDECPYGTWQLKGGDAFLRATIPVGALDQSALTFTGGGGAVLYTFKADGTLNVVSNPLLGRFDVKLDQEISSLIIDVTGVASAKYKVKNGKIEVGEILSNQIKYKSTMEGDEMMTSIKAADFLPLFVEPYKVAKYECTGDSLFLTIVDLPGDIPPIEFVRLQPTPTP
jgi:hypothetical protein